MMEKKEVDSVGVGNVIGDLEKVDGNTYKLKLKNKIIGAQRVSINKGVCTDNVGNLNEAAERVVTINGKEWISNGDKIENNNGRYEEEPLKLILPFGAKQYGPYINLAPGKYRVEYLGNNLNDDETSYAVSTQFKDTDEHIKENGAYDYESTISKLEEGNVICEFTVNNDYYAFCQVELKAYNSIWADKKEKIITSIKLTKIE